MVEKQTVPHVFLGLEKGGAFLQLPKLSKRYCKKYANMPCIYNTMNLLYFSEKTQKTCGCRHAFISFMKSFG